MDFVALDFETANHKRPSACSLGMTFVKNNSIVDSKYWLIKPEPFEFDGFNMALHGITPDDVKDAPTFQELWTEIAPSIQNNILVAHNASFDISVLRRSLELYEIPEPDFDFLCTYRIAQSAFPSSGSYRLNMICTRMGIQLENHHNAADDSDACANILCSLMEQEEITTMDELKKKFLISPGYCRDTDYAPCRCKKKTSSSHTKIDKASSCSPIYFDEDFNGKNFVFTGTLMSMPRSQATDIVIKCGGKLQNAITQKTDYLVVGIQDFKQLAGHTESTKMRKAYEVQQKGGDIKIIGEDEFVNMIDDEFYKL